MRIPIQPQHFSGTIGHAHRVDLEHPALVDRLRPATPVRLWVRGAEVTVPTSSLLEVQEQGDGRTIVDGKKLWLSLPGNRDPRQPGLNLQVEIGVDSFLLTPPPGSPDESMPVLIIGPQRSGTTALQWALDAVTPFKAPRDLRGILLNTLEGFYLTQLLTPFLTHPFLSPFGPDGNAHFWKTGLFMNSGIAFEMLSDLARHIDGAYSTMSATNGTWIDKCPGWDTVAVAPIFAALFPRGRVFFMSREPVGTVLSILRLNGMLPAEVGEDRALEAMSRSCALWVLGHYLWRKYAGPRVPDSRRLEIRFADLRSRDESLLKSIADCLELDSQAAEAIREELARPSVPSHRIDRAQLPDWMPSLIWQLCRDEAGSFGYEEPVCTRIPAGIESQARDQFVRVSRHIRNVLGISPEALEWNPETGDHPVVRMRSRDRTEDETAGSANVQDQMDS